MSERKGLLMTCDRCGYSLFRALVGKKEMDGGFSRYDMFEPEPDGWGFTTGTGTLCPACNAEYKDMIAKFMGRTKPDGA